MASCFRNDFFDLTFASFRFVLAYLHILGRGFFFVCFMKNKLSETNKTLFCHGWWSLTNVTFARFRTHPLPGLGYCLQNTFMPLLLESGLCVHPVSNLDFWPLQTLCCSPPVSLEVWCFLSQCHASSGASAVAAEPAPTQVQDLAEATKFQVNTLQSALHKQGQWDGIGNHE